MVPVDPPLVLVGGGNLQPGGDIFLLLLPLLVTVTQCAEKGGLQSYQTSLVLPLLSTLPVLAQARVSAKERAGSPGGSVEYFRIVYSTNK